MAATIKLSEAEQRKPGFATGRPAGVPWTLTVTTADGQLEFIDADWEARSKFGLVHNVVVCDTEGQPLFERPGYREAPNVNVVAFGEKDGEVYVAVLHEGRPHADHPEDPSRRDIVRFGQVPMGFLEKLLGKDAPLEQAELAATREVAEETGGTAVLEITRPKCPWHYPNPTFVETNSELFFVKVDLDRLEKMRPHRGELIYKARYVTVRELIRRTAAGVHEGAYYRMCTSNGLWWIFFCTYPQYFRP